jgi:hypothetical protein
VVFDEIGDAVRDDAGLAATSTGQDKKRSIDVLDCFALDII